MHSAISFSSSAPSRREQRVALRLHQLEDRGIANDTVLHRLEQAGAVFALRQCRQHIGIDQHRQRLMKRPDQVLARGQIHAGLAADRRVHLRQQRGRNLHHRNAAHEDGREKSAYIAHHSAAQREDDRAAGQRRCSTSFAASFSSCASVLAALAVGHLQDLQLAPGASEALLQRAAPVLADRREVTTKTRDSAGMTSRSVVAAERSRPRSTSTSYDREGVWTGMRVKRLV